MNRIPISPFSIAAAFLILLGLVLYTWLYVPFPSEEQAFPKDPVAEGNKLYVELRCDYCHKLEGKGGEAGPALDNVGFRRTGEWLAHHFRDPKKLSPGSLMPRLNLTDPEVNALTAYMNSLGGAVSSSQAPALYEKHCASCHSFKGLGPEARMNLSLEGRFRDRDFIRNYIKNPSHLNAMAGMKGFQSKLNDAEIEDLANFISQKGR